MGSKQETNGELTPQQERFCQEYLVDLNYTQAAVRAEYSKHTAHAQGCRLAKNPKVAARIKELMDERGERTKVPADRVILELERMAMWDPKDLAHVKSPEDIVALPEDVRRAIVGWGYDKLGNFVLKMAKEKALELLGRHHKSFTDKVEHSGKVTLEDLVAEPDQG